MNNVSSGSHIPPTSNQPLAQVHLAPQFSSEKIKTILESLSPAPQEITVISENVLTLPKLIGLSCLVADPRLLTSIDDFSRKLSELNIDIRFDQNRDVEALIRLEISADLPAQAYTIETASHGILIKGGDPQALHYGMITLGQLFKASVSVDNVLFPHLKINDAPKIANRGVLLDVSRDKVPTIESLYLLVDRLADQKVNQLQLYTEHTFAYHGHPEASKGSDAYTADDIRLLDAYCHSHFIELVPNQNSLGHMHRWLTKEGYEKYAENASFLHDPNAPHLRNYSADGVAGYSLNTTSKKTFRLLSGLYDELLPLFRSSKFNVGLDESFDLLKGGGRSAKKIEKKGAMGVYEKYLKRVYKLVKERKHGMQYWADFIATRSDVIAKLPKDATALIWGYEKGHPFHLQADLFRRHNIPFYLCPSTCTWNTIGGRTENAVKNLTEAAIVAKEALAEGYLITDWGDNGHTQPLSVSFLGYLVGSAAAWNPSQASKMNREAIINMLNTHIFKDSSGLMGEIAYEVGNIYQYPYLTKEPLPGCSILFRLLVFDGARPEVSLENVSKEGVLKAKQVLGHCLEQLSRTEMRCKDAPIILAEYKLVIKLLEVASDLGLALLDKPTVDSVQELKEFCRDNKDKLSLLLKDYEDVWLSRNRQGGLSDSLKRLRHLVDLILG